LDDHAARSCVACPPSLANVVQGVGQLAGALALRCSEDVAPLVAHVTDDDVAGVLELLPLAGLEGNGGGLEADGLDLSSSFSQPE